MPLFLIPLAFGVKALLLKAGVVASHHAAAAAVHHGVVATAAHAGNHVVLQSGVHFAQTTVNAALAAGSVMVAVSIVSSAALTAIVFYGQVEEYRRLNHLDENGNRKTRFHQIDKCQDCSCADFSLSEKRDGTTYCVCGHQWSNHHYKNVDEMEEEWRRFAKSVAIDTRNATFQDVMRYLKNQ
jgi:hypothetical protein